MKAKKWRDNELKGVVSHNLGDVVRFVLKCLKLLMGFGKAFFLQMQPNFVSHLKLMWHPMLTMPLFVYYIGFIPYVVNVLEGVLDVLNKLGGFIGFRLNMCRFSLCSCKRQCNINGT